MLQCAAFAGPPGPAFSFSAFPFARQPFRSTLWGGAGFSHQRVAVVPRFAHNCPTLAQQGLSGAALVSFPHLALKTAHRASHGLFLLCLIFSPTGKGWADLAPVLLRLTQICPQLPHTPSTGQVTDFGGVVSLPGFQNRTQGLTGPSLALTVFS